MSKNILLARPHPFLVDTMKPWLPTLGYQVQRIEALADIDHHVINAPNGVIISLALTSTITQSADVVLKKVRERFINVPIVLASLLEFDRAENNVLQIVSMLQINATLLNGQSPLEHPQLGNPNSFLYLSNCDITDASTRHHAGKLLQKHFG